MTGGRGQRGIGFLIAFAGSIVASSSAAYADEVASVQPPRSFEVRSPNGQCIAYADAAASRITGSRLGDKGAEKLWVIPEHQQVIYVADDCQSVMALYRGGGSIIWQEHSPSTVVLFFFRSGRLLKRFTLGELYPDIDALPQSVSHTRWLPWRIEEAPVAGWEGGKWFIRTVDGRKILFDPATGGKIN